MRNAKVIAGLMLASCLVAAPAYADGLLGGLLGGGGDGGGILGGGSSGGGGLLGGGSSGGGSNSSSTTINAPGVATDTISLGNNGTRSNGTLLNGGGSTINLGLNGVVGSTSNVGVQLPGTGTGADNALDQLAASVNGVTSNGGSLDTLIADAGLSGPQGGLGGALGTGQGGLLGGNGNGTGGGGNGGGGNGGHGGGGGGNGGGAGAGGGFAYFARAGVSCSGQNAGLIAQQLVSRDYSQHAMNAIRGASNVRVVPIKLCAQVRNTLSRAAASDSRINLMRGVASSEPIIRSSLNRSHHGINDVLAMDRSNGTVTVYVD